MEFYESFSTFVYVWPGKRWVSHLREQQTASLPSSSEDPDMSRIEADQRPSHAVFQKDFHYISHTDTHKLAFTTA